MNFGGGARRDTAVHETGHAVARVLSIGRVGITNENAIRWIEMDWGTPHCSVFELPLNMSGLKEFGEREGIREGIWPTVEEWRKLFSFMGIDPLEWASVRLFEITAGARDLGPRCDGLDAIDAWHLGRTQRSLWSRSRSF
jgi:hypothetical protein